MGALLLASCSYYSKEGETNFWVLTYNKPAKDKNYAFVIVI